MGPIAALPAAELCAADTAYDSDAQRQFLIDWLKTDAPFWKLEETPAGERWVEARETDATAKEKWR